MMHISSRPPDLTALEMRTRESPCLGLFLVITHVFHEWVSPISDSMIANASIIISKEAFEYLGRHDNPREESIVYC